MPPELAAPRHTAWVRGLGPPWGGALVRVVAAWILLIATFAGDWLRILDQWWNSSTYNHMLLVPPMVAWLAWQRRGELSQLRPIAWAPGALAMLPILLVWVIGAISGIDLLRQSAVVALLPASALVMLGPTVFLALLFPLCFMAFMVPFGDEFVPLLQQITARLVIFMTSLSGIPAHIDGVFIDTPAGLFEVAEACSGVKFLIAMIALGAFVANVGFLSWRRRMLFMAMCILVPILANGVRAYATILAAQYVGAQRAGGFDHIVYGWVFFALVIALVLGLSWRWFDRPTDAPFVRIEPLQTSPLLLRLTHGGSSLWLALAAFGLPVVGAVTWARIADAQEARFAADVALPAVPGWQQVSYAPAFPWSPLATGAKAKLLGRYRNAAGAEVDVFYALYSVQREGSEAGGFGQGALPTDAGWSWLGGGDWAPLARNDRLRAEQGTERLAETYYRSGDLLTGSNLRLRLNSIRDRLVMAPQPTAMLILSCEVRPDRSAARDLAEFRRTIGPLGQWMDRIGAGR